MKAQVLFIAVSAVLLGTAHAGEPVSISRIDEERGMVVALVENRSASAITSLLVEATIYSGGKPKLQAVRYHDVYVNAYHDKELQGGKSMAVPLVAVDAARKGSPSIIVSAALFADGSSYGTVEGLRVLRGRRSAASTAIERYRNALIARTGSDLPALRAAVQEVRIGQDAELRARSRNDVPVFSAAGQVGDWVSRAFDGTPLECGRDCVARRVEFVLGGLDRWQAELSKGLAEIAQAR